MRDSLQVSQAFGRTVPFEAWSISIEKQKHIKQEPSRHVSQHLKHDCLKTNKSSRKVEITMRNTKEERKL